MKILFVFIAILLAGCGTTAVPVAAKFPELPQRLMEKCPPLQQLPEDAKLSDISKAVVHNYTTYYECAVKHDGIVEWYHTQKRIYENIK